MVPSAQVLFANNVTHPRRRLSIFLHRRFHHPSSAKLSSSKHNTSIYHLISCHSSSSSPPPPSGTESLPPHKHISILRHSLRLLSIYDQSLPTTVRKHHHHHPRNLEITFLIVTRHAQHSFEELSPFPKGKKKQARDAHVVSTRANPNRNRPINKQKKIQPRKI
ncbi:hypothetical protein B0T16DRAFT_197442 [Cercophora newfieldiana]|uniref:Uncharacterized protein n=1 Tax=Cercophora newfieldiana TaxID=92897 RepID=A0AA39Y431_9PEZI|nr:hypothetical protein B0T16DRAFT_197442 [Cercophora newfieldiana]